jgi:hypothetical protein
MDGGEAGRLRARAKPGEQLRMGHGAGEQASTLSRWSKQSKSWRYSGSLDDSGSLSPLPLFSPRSRLMSVNHNKEAPGLFITTTAHPQAHTATLDRHYLFATFNTRQPPFTTSSQQFLLLPAGVEGFTRSIESGPKGSGTTVIQTACITRRLMDLAESDRRRSGAVVQW